MTGMSIQDRYNDITEKSGLSEEIIRRVFKATRESIAESLKNGERATIPGICTMIPEIKNRIRRDPNEHGVDRYIKVKCVASSAMETELEKISDFNKTTEDADEYNGEVVAKLNFAETTKGTKFNPKTYGVRTSQISALL